MKTELTRFGFWTAFLSRLWQESAMLFSATTQTIILWMFSLTWYCSKTGLVGNSLKEYRRSMAHNQLYNKEGGNELGINKQCFVCYFLSAALPPYHGNRACRDRSLIPQDSAEPRLCSASIGLLLRNLRYATSLQCNAMIFPMPLQQIVPKM